MEGSENFSMCVYSLTHYDAGEREEAWERQVNIYVFLPWYGEWMFFENKCNVIVNVI